jgi:hypothetical protein
MTALHNTATDLRAVPAPARTVRAVQTPDGPRPAPNSSNLSRSELRAAYDAGTLDWKSGYQLTAERGRTGLDLAAQFLTTVFSGVAPAEVTGRADNRTYGDLRVLSGATVEVKTQVITPWTPPVAGEAAATRKHANLYPEAWQAMRNGRMAPRRDYPTNFVELGVALLDDANHKDYHADWAERTAEAFHVTVAQVHSARIASTKERCSYVLGDFPQVAVAFTSWQHAALVVYCEPITRSLVAYTGKELLAYMRRAFTQPDRFGLVRDAGKCSPGTIGMLGVPYGERRFQQMPDGGWKSLSPSKTRIDMGVEVRALLGYQGAAAA